MKYIEDLYYEDMQEVDDTILGMVILYVKERLSKQSNYHVI